MRRGLLPSAFLTVLVACAHGQPKPQKEAQEQAQREILTAKALVEKIEASDAQFEIREAGPGGRVPEERAVLLWPAFREVISHAQVARREGRTRVLPPAVRDDAAPIFQEAEGAFGRHDLAEAQRQYTRGLALQPDFVPGLVGLGDCAFAAGDFAGALALYDRALALNPDNATVQFFRGHMLLRLGRLREARAAFVDALVLRPRYPMLLELLKRAAPYLDATLHAEPLRPTASFEQVAPKHLVVEGVADSFHWMGYAMCRAYQATCPEGQCTDTPDHRRWSNQDEHQCFGVLLQVYEDRVGKAEVQHEPALDRSLAALEVDLFEGFLLYEVASRLDPHVTLVQPPELREQVRRYVEKFVLVAN